MNIIKANLKDVKELVKIDKIAHKELKWWIPKNTSFFKKFISNKNNQILLANNGKIIGYLGLEFNKGRKSTWINEVYVIPQERKNGIAGKLVKQALKNWDKKSKSIVLLTADKNLKVFEKLNFKKTMNFMEYKK